MDKNNKIDLNNNYLFFGDNLSVMQKYIEDETIDLIYLDPPFNSNRNYNKIYKTETGRELPEQVEAFCDTWEMDAEKEQLAKDMPKTLRQAGYDDNLVKFWENLMPTLQATQPKLLAYLLYMTVRLIEMKRILKNTGSIYLHCDPTASHYIKIVMDGLFGYKNFRNEIVWKRGPVKGAKATSKQFGRNIDIILFYSKSKKYIFYNIYKPYDLNAKHNKFKFKDKDGRLYSRDTPLGDYSEESIEKFEKEGRIYVTKNGKKQLIRYLDESKGNSIGCLWDDINVINQVANERVGYPTQKPIALLDRIIKASCPEAGVVFDPFCGCGTTITATIEADKTTAKKKRTWIGCDIAMLSINLIRKKLIAAKYGLKDKKDYYTTGVPETVEQAQALFKSDPMQFEYWCVEEVGGFCNAKKGADKGIDGHIYFGDPKGKTKKLKRMVLQVKGGKNLGVSLIRDLRGVMEREKADMAGFICLGEPTKPMIQEAAKAGQIAEHKEAGKDKTIKYDKIQILTVKDMLEKENKFKIPYIKVTSKKGEQHQEKFL